MTEKKIRFPRTGMSLSIEELQKLTCLRLSEEIGEEIVHGVDVLVEAGGDNRINYTSLTEKGQKALSAMAESINRAGGRCEVS